MVGDGPPVDARLVDGPADSDVDAAIDAAPVRCQDNPAYVSLGGFPSTYRFTGAAASWMDAVLACEADGGAHLAVPDSAAEASAVGELGDWVGVSDQADEGMWVTIFGVAPGHLVFEAGQPDGGESEDCLRVFNTGEYEDRGCQDTRDFVCECPP
jgi:hypothetical protein